jgi:hypothetical protein
MLLTVIGQPLGTAKRVLESRWEMPKGYWITSGQFLEGIGKQLGNAQILIGDKTAFPSGHWLKRGISIPFL